MTDQSQLDIQLISRLHALTPKDMRGDFTNLIKDTYSKQELSEFERMLREKGVLNIPTIDGHSVTVDGIEQPVSFVAATEISQGTPNHGEMSSMLYLRDHIQAASVLMELHLSDSAAYPQEGRDGKKLLMSALHLMSTPAQLQRFKNLIANRQASQEDWPHISLLFDDLAAEKLNGWRNKQDTFQMLAYLACDALERGFISLDELSESHKTFLGSVAPLLKAVGFPNYENSGSWEEIEARRTSVMTVETALLHKIDGLVHNESFGFLKGRLKAEEITALRDAGLTEIGRRLPFESPDYPKDSIKYREADTALIYVLMYDIPKLLADKRVAVGQKAAAMNERAIEELVLKELDTLNDPTTGGIQRYMGDSYQRVNFHTGGVQQTIAAIKQQVKQAAAGGEIDLDKKQSLRNNLTPQGREAAWTHPLGQLSAWAAKRALAAQAVGQADDAKHYHSLSTRFFNRTTALITSDDQWHAVLNASKQYVIQKVPSNRLPECYVAYKTADGKTFTVPSPHTPLNWSSAMLKEAVGLLRIATVLQ